MDEHDDLTRELAALRAEVAKLGEQRFFTFAGSPLYIAGLSLLRGLFFGLGSAVGATLLVAVLVSFLGSMDFIPVLGDWAQRIVDQIELKPAE